MAPELEKNAVQKLDLNDIEDVIRACRADFDKPEICKAILASKRPVVTASAKLERHIMAEGLPLYERTCRKLDESRVWDTLKFGRDVTLTGVAGYVGYLGFKYLKGMVTGSL